MAYEPVEDESRPSPPSASSLALVLFLSLSAHAAVLWALSAPSAKQNLSNVAVFDLTPLPQAASPQRSTPPPPARKPFSEVAASPAGKAQETGREAEEAARRSYLDLVYALLDARKTYPASALRRRREGSATLKMVIDRSGALASLDVDADGEDFARASRAAAVAAQPFPPLPREVSGRSLSVDITLVYRLKR